MSRMKDFWSRFVELGEPPEYYREWLERQKEMHDFVRTVIESSLILAVLQLGADKMDSFLLWGLWFILYMSLIGYLLGYLRFVGRAIADRWGKWSSVPRIILGVGVTLIASLLPWLLNPVIEKLITAGVGT